MLSVITRIAHLLILAFMVCWPADLCAISSFEVLGANEIFMEGPLTVRVCNDAQVVHEVEVICTLPDSLRYWYSDFPPAMERTEKEKDVIVWDIGTLPGEATVNFKVFLRPRMFGMSNQTISWNVKSRESGQSKTFTCQTVIDIPCGYPAIHILLDGPSEVMTGDEARYAIELRNVGSSQAKNIAIYVDVPEGMKCREHFGTTLKWTFENLRPLETRSLHCNLEATTAGLFTTTAAVVCRGTLCYNTALSTRVISVCPTVRIDLPDRAACAEVVKGSILVKNCSDNVIENVVIISSFPSDLKIISSAPGSYKLTEGTSWSTVRWRLRKLPPHSEENIYVKLAAFSAGRFYFITRLLQPATDLANFQELEIEAVK